MVELEAPVTVRVNDSFQSVVVKGERTRPVEMPIPIDFLRKGARWTDLPICRAARRRGRSVQQCVWYRGVEPLGVRMACRWLTLSTAVLVLRHLGAAVKGVLWDIHVMA